MPPSPSSAPRPAAGYPVGVTIAPIMPVEGWQQEYGDLLDAGVIFGTGFAPFRGGPIQHIRSVGAARLKARLEELAAKHGDRFTPRPGWDSLAD